MLEFSLYLYTYKEEGYTVTRERAIIILPVDLILYPTLEYGKGNVKTDRKALQYEV